MEELDKLDPEHPQWKRRRRWNAAGAATGLLGFIACGVAVMIGEANEDVVDFSRGAMVLFLVSAGIYVGTAILRNR